MGDHKGCTPLDPIEHKQDNRQISSQSCSPPPPAIFLGMTKEKLKDAIDGAFRPYYDRIQAAANLYEIEKKRALQKTSCAKGDLPNKKAKTQCKSKAQKKSCDEDEAKRSKGGSRSQYNLRTKSGRKRKK